MIWLDKVKARNPTTKEAREKVIKELGPRRGELALMVMERSWVTLEMDRFIELAERAEWSGEGLHRNTYVDACPVCCARKPVTNGKHPSYCPLSDEWVKK